MCSKKISIVELCTLAILSWLLIWHWGPTISTHSTAWITFGFIAVIFYISYLSPVFIHGDDSKYRGLSDWKTCFIRTDNFVPALYRFGIITVAGGLFIIAAALVKNPLIFQQLSWNIFFLKLFLYLFYGAVQGLITLFILMRLIDLLSCAPFELDNKGFSGKSCRILMTVIITLYFSLVHLPNFHLMGIILIFTPVILWQYFKTPNFFLLVCTHAILGTLLHRVYELPMRIGPFYTHSDRYIIRELFPFIARIIGNSW